MATDMKCYDFLRKLVANFIKFVRNIWNSLENLPAMEREKYLNGIYHSD